MRCSAAASFSLLTRCRSPFFFRIDRASSKYLKCFLTSSRCTSIYTVLFLIPTFTGCLTMAIRAPTGTLRKSFGISSGYNRMQP